MSDNIETMETSNTTLFGERLRFLRKERGLLQSQLADFFGVSTATIGTYERSEREPTLSLLLGFADFFGVSTDYIMGKSEYRERVDDLYATPVEDDKPVTVDYMEFLASKQISIHGYELSPEEKARLSGISLGLFYSKLLK